MSTSDGDQVHARVSAFLRDHAVATAPTPNSAGWFDVGLAFVHVDAGASGFGADVEPHRELEQRIVDAGAAADRSDCNVIGLRMAAPTRHAHSSEAPTRVAATALRPHGHLVLARGRLVTREVLGAEIWVYQGVLAVGGRWGGSMTQRSQFSPWTSACIGHRPAASPHPSGRLR